MQSRSSDIPNNHSPIRDVDRLQHEFELMRRQLAEQIRLSEHLQKDLESARNREHEYTQNLGKALEQVEENLERSNVCEYNLRFALFLMFNFFLEKGGFCRNYYKQIETRD